MFITDINKKGKEITRKNKSYNSKLMRKKYKNLEKKSFRPNFIVDTVSLPIIVKCLYNLLVKFDHGHIKKLLMFSQKRFYTTKPLFPFIYECVF
jgi:hypothetical protein